MNRIRLGRALSFCVFGLLLAACSAPEEGDEWEEDIASSSQEALVIGTGPSLPGGMAIETCLTKTVCTIECTEPTGPDDIYHCQTVCKRVCRY
jgi:hypothetical protein